MRSYPSLVPTRPSTDNSNSPASTAFVGAAVAAAGSSVVTIFSSVAVGFVPASGGGTTNFLRADASFADPKPAAATKAEQEAASDTTVMVTPGRQQYHPSAAKVWCMYDTTGTQTIYASYNMTTLSDGGTGISTLTIATDFSSASWSPAFATASDGSAQTFIYLNGTRTGGALAAGSIDIATATTATAVDRTFNSFCGFGTQ